MLMASALLGALWAGLFPSTAAARSPVRRPSIKPPYGNDISYPQCGASFPRGASFGLVGVDDGIANQESPCFGPYRTGGRATSELYWGSRLRGGARQPAVALYVNTADPGNSYQGQPIADWPRPGSRVPGLTNPYARCGTDPHNPALGANSAGCAWVYGADLASLDASPGPPLTGTAPSSFLTSATTELEAHGAAVSGRAGSYHWWLDVETANTWRSGNANGLAMNAAVLEGMLEYLRSLGVRTVGIYSTASQWHTITGGQARVERNWRAAGHAGHSPLHGVPDWLPGARRQAGAVARCSRSSFTDGRVALAEWTQDSLDYDQSCLTQAAVPARGL
jgi:hypothetical protein